MQDINRFIKNNFNVFHIIGMVAGVGLSMIYWAKKGQFSDKILKSSPILMAIWGLLIGYILMDMVFNARKRKNEEENEK